MEVRTTADGILRAFGLLVAQASKPRQVKPRYTYRPFGSSIHATRRLTKDEHKIVDDIAAKLKQLNPNNDADAEQYKALLKDLSKQPVRFVPLKYAERIERSKRYPYGSKRQGY